jgi:hypothetical protein
MVALETFMKSHLDDIPDYLENKRTYLSESFHSLTTHYCPKGVPFSFETYKARKYLAVLHWNENSGKKKPTHEFRRKILEKFLI